MTAPFSSYNQSYSIREYFEDNHLFIKTEARTPLQICKNDEYLVLNLGTRTLRALLDWIASKQTD